MRMEVEGARLRALVMNALTKPGAAPIKAVDLMAHHDAPSVASLGDVLSELGVKVKGK
jgi:hypothetical protein